MTRTAYLRHESSPTDGIEIKTHESRKKLSELGCSPDKLQHPVLLSPSKGAFKSAKRSMIPPFGTQVNGIFDIKTDTQTQSKASSFMLPKNSPYLLQHKEYKLI